MSGLVASASSHRPAGSIRSLDNKEIWEFAAVQTRQLLTRAPGAFPLYTEKGRWVLGDDPWAPNWGGGFLSGILWLLFDHTRDPWFDEQAQKCCLLLEQYKNDRRTHDLGFILEPSWGCWHDRNPSPNTRDVLVAGGRTMAARLQQPGGYLSSWIDPASTLIDIMMNVGLIFRAADYSGDDRLSRVALRHCHTTRRHLVRGDGSTIHEGRFDTHTGEYLHAATQQGWRSDSSWARGQAWAIYGFDTAFRHSGDLSLLATARQAANYYLEHTPSGGVPPNDFCEPNPEITREASAAAIAAAGMLRLAQSLNRRGDSNSASYREHALRIVETLRSTQYVAADTPGWEGITRHATYHQHRGVGVDESVMFGDYYFLEALDLAEQKEPHDG